jgi:hypothetical protein
MTRFPTRSRDLRRNAKAIGMKRNLRAELLEPRMLLSAVPTPIAMTALVAEANAFVEGGQYNANYNFGGSQALYVGTSSSTNGLNDYNTYLKFDLSKISGTITSAVLDLTPLNGFITPSSMIEVLDTSGSWTEGTSGYNPNSTGPITWNNAPPASGTIVATVPASQLQADTPISINVSSLISANQTSANFLVELEQTSATAVRGPAQNPWVEFASREFRTGPWSNATFLPTLLVSTSPVVPPAPPASLTVSASYVGSPAAVTGNTATLTASVTDTNTLSYSWKLTGAPTGATGSAAPVLSSVQGQAGEESVTFHDAGQYTFQVTVTDSTGATGTASVPVSVGQTLTSITVSPATVTVVSGNTQSFTATGLDQFGNAMTTQPTFTWNAAATIGTISTTTSATTTATLTPVTLSTGGRSVSGTVTASTSGISTPAIANITVVAPSPLGLEDPTLAALVPTLLSGSGNLLTYGDMLQIFQAVEGEQKSTAVVSAADMHDLNAILGDATTLSMPGYVQVLSSDVILDSNPADAHYQGASLGKLTAGSSGSLTVLTDLVNKWFLGLDLPAANAEGSYQYSSASTYASDPLFDGGTANTTNGTPSYKDLEQGDLGDCYFLSALGSIADASPQQAAIRNMFIPDGNGIYTVCFYTSSGTADYVTVNTALPVARSGGLIYEGLGGGNSLWLPLAEKAYAEWNETGNEGNGNVNTYAAIEGGWMGDVYNQVLSVKVTGGAQNEYWPGSSTSQQLESQFIAALGSSTTAVTIGTDDFNYSSSTGLYGDHAYVVLGYTTSSGTFQLYNPWGVDQPNQNLTWSQLYANCDGFADINTATTSASANRPTTTSSSGGTRPLLIAGNSGATVAADVESTASAAVSDAGPNTARTADTIAATSYSSSSDEVYMSPGRARVAESISRHDGSQTSTDLSADAVDALLADGSVFQKTAWI